MSRGLSIYNRKDYADIYIAPRALWCDYGGTKDSILEEKRKRRVRYEYSNGKLVQRWGKSGEKAIAYIHLQKRKLKVDRNIDLNHFYIYPGVFTSIEKNCFSEIGYNPEYIRFLLRRIRYRISGK